MGINQQWSNNYHVIIHTFSNVTLIGSLAAGSAFRFFNMRVINALNFLCLRKSSSVIDFNSIAIFLKCHTTLLGQCNSEFLGIQIYFLFSVHATIESGPSTMRTICSRVILLHGLAKT